MDAPIGFAAGLWALGLSPDDQWDKLRIARYGTLLPVPDAALEAQLDACGGFFHPSGTTRMAHRPEQGVVDRDLNLVVAFLLGPPNIIWTQLIQVSLIERGFQFNNSRKLV